MITPNIEFKIPSKDFNEIITFIADAPMEDVHKAIQKFLQNLELKEQLQIIQALIQQPTYTKGFVEGMLTMTYCVNRKQQRELEAMMGDGK